LLQAANSKGMPNNNNNNTNQQNGPNGPNGFSPPMQQQQQFSQQQFNNQQFSQQQFNNQQFGQQQFGQQQFGQQMDPNGGPVYTVGGAGSPRYMQAPPFPQVFPNNSFSVPTFASPPTAYMGQPLGGPMGAPISVPMAGQPFAGQQVMMQGFV
jgi:hypothetical protein